jgi:beta-lactamase regulating signal transducer with metallopeptidase domain
MNLLIDRLGLGGDADGALPVPLTSIGQELVHRFTALNVWTALLLSGALAVDRLVGRRARASWRIALYAPVFLRIAIPLDWSLLPANAPQVEMIFAPLLVPAIGAKVEVPQELGTPWYAIAAALYFAIAAILVARLVAAEAKLERALREAKPASDHEPGIEFPILEHPELGPMVVGLWEPRIVVPASLLVAAQKDALARVLRHEGAHLRRRDPWLMMAMHVGTVIAWPILPLWIAAKRVRHLMELACDEAALRGFSDDERRQYGHTLLDLAERHTLGDLPLGTGGLHFGSTLRARIEALAAERHWPLGVQAIVVVGAAIVLVVACGGSSTAVARGPANGSAAGSKDVDAPGYGYEFAPDTVEEMSRAPAPPKDWRPLAERGRLPPEAIEDMVRIHFGGTLACFEIGRRVNPALSGVVTVRFVIQEDGSVRDAADERSTLPNKDVVRCIVADFKKRRFQESHGGEVTVLYPIRLGS